MERRNCRQRDADPPFSNGAIHERKKKSGRDREFRELPLLHDSALPTFGKPAD
jgi:hypothetical protein